MSFRQWYTTWFLQIIRWNDERVELLFDMWVQKVDQYKKIWSYDIDIKKEKFYKFKLKWDCNFLTTEGKCYNWLIDIDIWYINPQETKERTTLALPMDCITANEGVLHALESSWMAFINVYDQNWNILEKVKDKKFEICYYMPEQYWEMEKEKLKKKKENGEKIGFDDQWNYWWFDKTKNLWIADKESIRETGEHWICFQTNILY